MFTLAAWLHNIDPFAIEFPEGFFMQGIRWYGLAYLATFVLGYFFTRRIVSVGVTTLRPVEVMDFVISVAIAVVVGGRLGYVIFYKPELLITFSSKLPYWGVFQLNQGGMSSHGGMIGVGLVTWWYAWRSRRKAALATDPKERLAGHSWLHLFDLTALVATLGFLFGRLANFVNAELIGRVCDPDLPWAVKFPQELFDISTAWASGDAGAAQQLRQLAPAVENVSIGGAAVTAESWSQAIATQDIRYVDSVIQAMIGAIQDGGSRGQLIGRHVEPLLLPHHPSQLYAAVTEGLIVFLVLLWLWRKPQKPGVIAGMFGALYGVMRVFNEFYRTPDAHIADQEFAAIGLTRGQLLSIVLAIGGIALTWWCARRNAPRMGGLLPVKQAT